MGKEILNDEEEFLLQNCSRFLDITSTVQLKDLPKESWEYLKRQAQDSALAPLIYSHFRSIQKTNFPHIVRNTLSSLYYQVLVRNTVLLEEYNTLKMLFESLRISFIPLKGIYFLETYYSNDIGIRYLSDIDILFRKEEQKKIHEILIEKGYRAYQTMPRKISKILQNATPINYSKGDITLDVHFALNRLESYHISLEDVWENTITGSVSSEKYLSNEHQLIHLCVHAFLHLSIYDLKLISFLDVVVLINEANIDWNKIKLYCEKYNCNEEVYSILFITNSYFNCEIPVLNLKGLDQKKINVIISKFLLILRENRADLKSKNYKRSDRYFQFFHLLSWRKRILFVWYYIFPDTHYLRQLYGNKFSRIHLWLKHVLANLS